MWRCITLLWIAWALTTGAAYWRDRAQQEEIDELKRRPQREIIRKEGDDAVLRKSRPR